jgi:AI-2 transport protein TqsA
MGPRGKAETEGVMGQRASPRWVFSAAAALVAVVGLRHTGGFLAPVLFGAMVAGASAPMVTWLRLRRVPVMVGAAVVLVVDLLAVGALGAWVLSAASDLHERLPGYSSRLSDLSGTMAARLGPFGAPLRPLFEAPSFDAAALVQGCIGLTSFAAIVVFVGFFTLCEADELRTRLVALAPSARKRLERVDRVLRDVRSYLLVKCFTSALAAALTWLVLSSFDLPLTTLLALLMFTLHFVPNVGAPLAASACAAVALAERGPATAMGAGLAIATVVLGVGCLLEPQLLGRAVRLSPLTVLLGMLFWGWLWGPAGAVLSVPLMVGLRAALEESEQLQWLALLLGGEPSPSATPARPALLVVRTEAPRQNAS